MKIELFNSRFIKYGIPDDKTGLTGDWIAQSNYEFELYANKYDTTHGIFYVAGELDVDFAGGGSLAFICLLSYRLTGLSGKPEIDKLTDVAHTNAPIDFEALFINHEIVAFNSPSDELWAQQDREVLYEKIKKAIEETYPS